MALTVCTLGVSRAVNAAANDIAINDDSARGVSFAHNVVAPLVNQAMREGDGPRWAPWTTP
jgi:hypothetical protein